MNEIKWIPVKERLPEKDGEYLVTLSNGTIDIDFYKHSYTYTADGETYTNEYDEWLETDEYEYVDGIYVLAWSPLPEAYKED